VSISVGAVTSGGGKGPGVGLRSRRGKPRAPVAGWLVFVAVACGVGWVSSNGVAARAAAPRRLPVAIPAHLSCVRILVCSPYEVHYSGVETLLTVPAVAPQPFFQAGRKLYIKLRWDVKVERNKTTNAPGEHSAKRSGIVDLTIPDSPTLDCTAHYTMSSADADHAITYTYMNIVAGGKTLVWTSGIPAAAAACNDSSPHPQFASQAFQDRFDRVFQPRFTVSCSMLNKGGGKVSKDFNFGPRKDSAGLGTVGLGQMEATIRSKVVISGVTCKNGLFG